MPRWFVRDRSGHLGVFTAEHVLPRAALGLTDEALDLTEEIIRLIGPAHRPIRGRHAGVHSGTVRMLAALARVRGYAFEAAALDADIVLARFAARPRGREAGFMAGLRTFGAGEAEPASALDRAHADGVCAGCIGDLDRELDDENYLHRLGLFVYRCDDEALGLLSREAAPTTPLDVARLGALAARCLRYAGELATADQVALDDLER